MWAFGKRGHAGSAGRLRYIFNNLAGCSLVRIVEEELIAVGIIDHQKAVAPRTLLNRNVLGLEFRAQRVQRGDLRLRLGVQGKENNRLMGRKPSTHHGPFEGRAVRHTSGTQLVPSGKNLARLEWVENSDVQLPEIRFISRGNDQLVNVCSGSNHSVLKQSIWF